MGIKDLFPMLQEKVPSAFVTIMASEFKGKKIAVDGYNLLYVMMAISHKKVVEKTDVSIQEVDRSDILNRWMSDVLDFVIKWMTYGATPVFVFDGKHPEEKGETQQKRMVDRQSLMNKTKELKEKLEQQKTEDILLIDPELIREYKKALSRAAYISADEMEYFSMLLSGIGIPSIYAIGDAEKVCTILCQEKKVDAVFSTDSDNLPLGCPLLIREFLYEKSYNPETKIYTHQVSTISIDAVLKGLNMSMKSFVDLCIMMGCDFNTNIPQIGKVKAFKLIQTFGTIDRMPRLMKNRNLLSPKSCGLPLSREYDLSHLRYQRCREIFSPVTSSELIRGGSLDLQDVFSDSGRSILSQFNLLNYLPRLVPLYANLIKPK